MLRDMHCKFNECMKVNTEHYPVKFKIKNSLTLCRIRKFVSICFKIQINDV